MIKRENSWLLLPSDPLCIFSSSPLPVIFWQRRLSFHTWNKTQKPGPRSTSYFKVTRENMSANICMRHCFCEVCWQSVSSLFFVNALLFVLPGTPSVLHPALLWYLGSEPKGLSLQRSRWCAVLCLARNLPFFQPQGTLLGVLLN